MAGEIENWSVQITLHADVRPAGVRREEPPAGAYEVLCAKSELGHAKDDPGKPYLRLHLKVAGPAGNSAMGMEFTDIVNLPNGRDAAKDRFTEGFLKKTLVSFGHDAARLAAANATVSMGPTAFNNQTGTVYFEPSPGPGAYSEVTYLDRTEFGKVLSGELRLQPATRKPAATGGVGNELTGAGGAHFGSLGGAPANAGVAQPLAGAAAVDAFLA